MGILRTDRVAGLGGAKAIKGSVKFSSGGALDIDLDGATIGTGNFTIEAWVYFFGLGAGHQITGSSSNNFNFYVQSTDGDLAFYDGSNTYDLDSSLVRPNQWFHVALVREGTSTNQTQIYVNGVNTNQITLATNFSFDRLLTGINYLGGSRGYGHGYTSNLRFTLDAVYTSAFTTPNRELTVLDNTIVLCCQSPGNIFQEATGKKIVVFKHGLDQGDPVASHFAPGSPVGFSTTYGGDYETTDVGTQYGSTFDGFTNFATSTYMVPPGGNTRERNRGRAVIGWANNPVNTGMDAFNIQSMGNATAFGNLTSGNRWGSHAFSSTTRGLWTGGYLNSGPAFYNIIEFVTIANNGNPIDFGDTTSQNYRSGCCSSSTRGLIALGYVAPNFSIVNTIDQVTMATTGNATNFGDLFQARANMASASSPTRGFFAGGVTPANQGTIDFVTIASSGDAQDFGDLQEVVSSPMALASSTRGIIGGGYPAPANTNVINFITIASAGNASDFGDLTGLYSVGSAVSNKTRGVFCGGYTAPSKHNLMEFVTISTTGNASDFGDITYARRDFGACSDSHGGLS